MLEDPRLKAYLHFNLLFLQTYLESPLHRLKAVDSTCEIRPAHFEGVAGVSGPPAKHRIRSAMFR